MKLSQMKPLERLKVFVYGHSGTGKTCFVSGFPGPIYLADFDGKASSAYHFLMERDAKKLDEIEVDNFLPSLEMGGRKVYDTFVQRLARLEKLAQEGKFPFATVALDSMTTFSEAMMQMVMEENPGVKRPNKHTLAMQDYLTFGSMFRPIVQRLLALPCNVVLVGHVKSEKDDQTGEVFQKPMLSGQLADRMPIIFEEVYYTYTEVKDGKVHYRALTRPQGRFTARTQIRGIPDSIPLDYRAIVHYTKLMSAAEAPAQTPAKEEATHA